MIKNFRIFGDVLAAPFMVACVQIAQHVSRASLCLVLVLGRAGGMYCSTREPGVGN